MALEHHSTSLLPVYGELAIISSSGVEKQCMLLKKKEYTIGRSRRCDVRINIKTVSRTHVRIRRDLQTQKMTLSNCGSGEDDLFVNKNIVKLGSQVPLVFGDVIELSGKVFKLRSPREENSVILDDTLLCSQPPIFDRSPVRKIPGGGGVRDTRCLPQPKDITETMFVSGAGNAQKRKRPSLSGLLRGAQRLVERSPAARNSPLALGTPDAVTQRTTSKSVRFSHFNQVKANGIQAFSPATKRRRVCDRKPTPGPGRLFRSGQLPQEMRRIASSNEKRLSDQKQVLRRTHRRLGFKSQSTQYKKQKLLLTPTVRGKPKPKTEEDRRKEIMRRLLDSSLQADDENKQRPRFLL